MKMGPHWVLIVLNTDYRGLTIPDLSYLNHTTLISYSIKSVYNTQTIMYLLVVSSGMGFCGTYRFYFFYLHTSNA